MLISEVIQIRSKFNERIIKLDAILTKLGGKTYIYVRQLFKQDIFFWNSQVSHWVCGSI